jgi:hypothetical protein
LSISGKILAPICSDTAFLVFSASSGGSLSTTAVTASSAFAPNPNIFQIAAKNHPIKGRFPRKAKRLENIFFIDSQNHFFHSSTTLSIHSFVARVQAIAFASVIFLGITHSFKILSIFVSLSFRVSLISFSSSILNSVFSFCHFSSVVPFIQLKTLFTFSARVFLLFSSNFFINSSGFSISEVLSSSGLIIAFIIYQKLIIFVSF